MAQASAATMLANVPQTPAQPTRPSPGALLDAARQRANPPPPESDMLRNLRLQAEYRRNTTADERRMLSQMKGVYNQSIDALRNELAASGMDRRAVNDIIKAERRAFNTNISDYQNQYRTQADTQRFAGFGEGNYYAPTYTYAGPEAEAVRQRFVQGQQFMQQYGIPQFYRQGRTAIGIREPQAYALSQAMADGQITADELTGQYGQYFNPRQAQQAVRNIQAIQPFVGNQNITAESFENKLKPVKGMEGIFQTRLAGGKYNNVVGIFRALDDGRYEYLGAAPTKTKKESGGFFGNVLRIGGALIAPFNPPLGALASGIGTLAAGGNLGQAILGAATTGAGAALGGIPGVVSIPAGVSSAIGGGIAAATPVTPQQPPIPSVAPGIV